MTDKSDLLPCPFCGAQPLPSFSHEAGQWDVWEIECDCGVNIYGPVGYRGDDAKCAAVRKWNTRAFSRPPADQVPDMVERDLYFATLLQQDTCAVVPVNRDHLKSVIADAKAALQAVPASREVRELRELLVEAQRHVADLAALPCEAVGPENAESCSCDPCRARSLNERIDFALKASGEE